MKSNLSIIDIKVEESILVHRENEEKELALGFTIEYFEGTDDDKIGKIMIKCETNGATINSNQYLKVIICGEFFVEEGSFNDYIINAVSILYPYLRAHVTTITSSMGIDRLTLPAINVIELLNQEQSEKE